MTQIGLGWDSSAFPSVLKGRGRQKIRQAIEFEIRRNDVRTYQLVEFFLGRGDRDYVINLDVHQAHILPRVRTALPMRLPYRCSHRWRNSSPLCLRGGSLISGHGSPISSVTAGLPSLRAGISAIVRIHKSLDVSDPAILDQGITGIQVSEVDSVEEARAGQILAAPVTNPAPTHPVRSAARSRPRAA